MIRSTLEATEDKKNENENREASSKNERRKREEKKKKKKVKAAAAALQTVDYTTMLLACRELQATVVPSKFETAIQPDAKHLLLSLRTSSSSNAWLELSWDERSALLPRPAAPEEEEEEEQNKPATPPPPPPMTTPSRRTLPCHAL